MFEQFVDLTDGGQAFYVLGLASQVILGYSLYLVSLLCRVRLCADDTFVCQGIVHRKFLLQIANLFLIAFNQQVLVSCFIYLWHVFYLLHSGGEPEGSQRFL